MQQILAVLDKIEFSDVYKFLASIGLICIGLAFIVPWFLSQNTGILLIDEKKLKLLTETAQKVIGNQQKDLFKLNQLAPYLAIFLMALGCTLLFVGLYSWNKRQKVVDNIQNEELKTRRISNMTALEKREQLSSEIDKEQISSNKDSDSEGIKGTSESVTDVNVNYSDDTKEEEISFQIDVENSVYQNLVQLEYKGFDVLQNIKIKGLEIDVLLSSRQNKAPDFVIEIIAAKDKLNLRRLQNAALKLKSSCIKLTNDPLFAPKGTLIIAHSGIDSVDRITYLYDQLKTIPSVAKLKIKFIFIKIEDIEDFDPQNFL